jgi:hypothetical protein
MANPHPISAGNTHWKLKCQFTPGRTNRLVCCAVKRNGERCGMLAMTRYRLTEACD